MSATVQRFVAETQSATAADHSKQLALLVLGEIGRDKDVDVGAQTAQLETAVFSAFESKSDDVQIAASFALGNIAVGNMSVSLSAFYTEILSPLLPSSQVLPSLLFSFCFFPFFCFLVLFFSFFRLHSFHFSFLSSRRPFLTLSSLSSLLLPSALFFPCVICDSMRLRRSTYR